MGKYRDEKDVPNDVLCDRLDTLANAVAEGCDEIKREFYMSIPCRPDNDADCVLIEAAKRIRHYTEGVIEVWYKDGDEPFICGVWGGFSFDCLSQMTAELPGYVEDGFLHDDGVYRLKPVFFGGQFGEYGRCEVPQHWLFEFVSLTPHEAVDAGA